MGRNSIKMFIFFHHFYSLDLGFEYCICYVLLHNKLPKTWLVKTTDIYYLRVYVCQESGCSLAGCLWLTVTNKVAVKPLAETEASASKKAHSWWVGGVSLSLVIDRKPHAHCMYLSIGSLGCLDIAAGLPQSEQGGSHNILHLSLGRKALSSAPFSLLEITRLCLLKGGE